jgi:hypothetical protein
MGQTRQTTAIGAQKPTNSTIAGAAAGDLFYEVQEAQSGEGKAIDSCGVVAAVAREACANSGDLVVTCEVEHKLLDFGSQEGMAKCR